MVRCVPTPGPGRSAAISLTSTADFVPLLFLLLLSVTLFGAVTTIRGLGVRVSASHDKGVAVSRRIRQALTLRILKLAARGFDTVSIRFRRSSGSPYQANGVCRVDKPAEADARVSTLPPHSTLWRHNDEEAADS